MSSTDEGFPRPKFGFEVPVNTPALIADFAEAAITYRFNENDINDDELKRYFDKPLLGSGSLALELYEQYEALAKQPISPEDYHVLDLDIVPSPFSTDEKNMVIGVLGDNYIVSNLYTRYTIRFLNVQEKFSDQNDEIEYQNRIAYFGVRDKDDDSTMFEVYLNADDTIDAQFMLGGKKYVRRLVTPKQQKIVAEMLTDLIDHDPLEE